MTSKEIVIKLIDNKLITGEEAYVLLNDLFKAEMVAVNETLKECSKDESTIKLKTPVWIPYTNTLTNSIDVSALSI